ncbi:DUF6792 domain-containing protein [Geobacillus icigianus]|uniref:DUF6792 domain-containing protein n=1 Tax=Geobacillus icigianus TaxID=1430331 RepID=A0ABU6BHE4_9BACL|nr:DUF6792 domain-containing protein [Geobacillus icigianus]MEB3751129.1 hypothetical protein [Geobacillus icigianus]
MSQKLVLNTDLLRARIMALEYANLTEAEIRRIYIEETGKEPPAYIKVYHSDDFKKGQDFGFDGTIIHFYDEKQGINQKYTIARGSEKREQDTWKPLDWAYNIFGIFEGQSKKQYNSALLFDKIVTKKINEELKQRGATIKLQAIGLGHSQGGNHSQMLQLTKKRFDQVYVINDAPPSVYHLAYVDRDFRKKIEKNFNIQLIDNYNAIYSLPPAELKAFAEEYYKKRVDEHSIHHLTAQEDLLYAVSGVRGFIDIGSRDFIDTNDPFTSLKSLIEKIPDKDVKAIQLYFSQYADVYNEKGFDGVVQAMTGVDLEWLESLESYGVGDYVWNAPDIVEKASDMVGEMKEKIPELFKHIKIWKRQKEAILQAFVDAGFLTLEQKEAIWQEGNKIEQDVDALEQRLRDLRDDGVWLVLRGPFAWSDPFVGTKLWTTFQAIQHYMTDLIARLQAINQQASSVRQAAITSIQAHSLHEVINALARSKGRAYDEDGNMILIQRVGTEEIRLNLSLAVRMYQKGMRIMEEKEAVLRDMKQLYVQEYVEDFERRKRDLMRNIEDMEQNPSAYQHLLGSFTYDAQQVYILRRIEVHESIPPLDPMIAEGFEEMLAYYEGEMAKGRELIASIKQSVEQLVEKEEQIANIFDLRWE